MEFIGQHALPRRPAPGLLPRRQAGRGACAGRSADPRGARRACRACRACQRQVKVEVSYHGFQAEGLVVDLQQPALQALMQAHRDITGRPATARVSTATTDVRFFHLYGQIPCTCYGPRGANIHGVDEWVSIESMPQVTAVLALFIARWCGVQPIDAG